MKVGIIGHTSGIGASIAEQFDDVVGYSRSNGHDIDNFEEFIEEIDSDGIDVLVINPHSGFRQTEMLYAVWDRWVHENKIIVVIGSEAGDNCYRKSHSYAVEKASLDAASSQLSRVPDARCRILNVRPGYVDTPRVSGVTSSKINPNELGNLVKQLVMLDCSMWVTNITIKPI